MDSSLRLKIWQRDNGTCQECKKILYKMIDPYEDIIKELKTIREIPIFKWTKNCWKCNQETPIITYDFAVAYDYHMGSIEKLDKLLMRKYPFVKEIFSKTMEQDVIANTCINCSGLQGNWFVMEDIIEMKASDIDMNQYIDTVISIDLEFEDLRIDKKELQPYRDEIPLIAHVHHKDMNNKNNELKNLILLCRECHLKMHSKK